MSELSAYPTKLPPEQETIRAKCFHPSGTFVKFPEEEIEQSIPDRFEKMVAQFPDRVAVKTGNIAWSYEELNKAANRVARAILLHRGEQEEPIGLLFRKGGNLIVAIMGVLKAGKTYVLLDTSLPVARIGFILGHSQPALLLTDTEHLSLAKSLRREGQVIDIDGLDSCVECENPGLRILPDAIAWIHYTSGSTGQPKGVIQTHRNALHVVMIHTNDYHVCSHDRLTFLASRGGDIFLALLNGACVFPVDIKLEGLADLAKILIKEEITIYGSVTSTFRHFLSTLGGAEKFRNLRLIKLGGEPIYSRDVELYRKFTSQDCILVNRLNGTETGTFCHYFVTHSSPIPAPVLPVGYPVKDKEVLLLGEDGKEVGINQIGEIAVRSRYLSPGYWRSGDLTRAAFLPDAEGGDRRTYLIGDLGRMLPGGCLVHLGRKDFQVKIRGNRVELAEVETFLLSLDGVKEAAVATHDDSSGNKRLVAYLALDKDVDLTVGEMRRALSENLPDYMIPSTLVTMEKLPVTGIGKVDRGALPKPGNSRPNLGSVYVAPRTSLEELLAKIWAEVLSLDRIGVHDNFFDLGGHSLAATRVVSQVIKNFQLELPLQSLFQSPTVAEMAAVIMEHQGKRLGEEELEHMLGELESLSDEEAQQLVAKETVKE